MNSFIEHKTNLIRKGLGYLRSIRRISNFIKQLYHVQTACYCSTASDFMHRFFDEQFNLVAEAKSSWTLKWLVLLYNKHVSNQ